MPPNPADLYCSNSYENASSNFRLHIPSDYQFLSDASSYNVNLSEGRKAETKRRYLREQQERTLFEITQMETVMNIGRRWEPNDREYKEAVEYINTRKYRRALERLHKLVVQRLFELHKMNLSNTGAYISSNYDVLAFTHFTGYKMRTHISHALQRRSRTIRNAVKSYNTAALALNPPRNTLDWSKVSHFTFLDQFNILKDTRHSVFDQPWAKPVVRSLMKQHCQIERAREEIVNCNIAIRRLHTSIVDEEKKFKAILPTLNASTLGPVSDFVQRRQAVNRLLLARIHRTYELPGFTGNPTAGYRKGSTDHPEPEAASESNVDPHSDDGEEEDDDEFTEGVGAVVEFMSNISLQ